MKNKLTKKQIENNKFAQAMEDIHTIFRQAAEMGLGIKMVCSASASDGLLITCTQKQADETLLSTDYERMYADLFWKHNRRFKSKQKVIDGNK